MSRSHCSRLVVFSGLCSDLVLELLIHLFTALLFLEALIISRCLQSSEWQALANDFALLTLTVNSQIKAA